MRNKARHVFLPQYLLLPYTLARGATMDFSQPTLDDLGAKIVLKSIEMLTPDLRKRK